MKLSSTESHSYSDFLTEFNTQIRQFLESELTNIKDLDLDTYEGGLESWFGPGSVMIYELNFTIGLIHTYNSTTLVIE